MNILLNLEINLEEEFPPTRPYLGCREFSAFFDEPDDEKPIDLTDELGRMLFDLNYQNEERKNPIFFNARLDNGVLEVPVEKYENVWGIRI